MIEFIELSTFAEFEHILNQNTKPQIHGVFVFKHSRRCFISSQVKKELTKNWQLPATKFPVYLVDVIKSRELSTQIAKFAAVEHQSPQLLFFKNKQCVGNASHHFVSVQTVNSWLHA